MVRFDKTKSLHLINTKAKTKRTARTEILIDILDGRLRENSSHRRPVFRPSKTERTKNLRLLSKKFANNPGSKRALPASRWRAVICLPLALDLSLFCSLPRPIRLLCPCSRACARWLITNITIRVFFLNLRENSFMLDLNVNSYVKKTKKTETWLNNIVKIKTNDYDFVFVFVFAEFDKTKKNKIGALKKSDTKNTTVKITLTIKINDEIRSRIFVFRNQKQNLIVADIFKIEACLLLLSHSLSRFTPSHKKTRKSRVLAVCFCIYP